MNPYAFAQAPAGAPRRIAVLGGGPTGLEVALAAREAGFEVRAYERADSPAGSVRAWGHVRMFTPWPMNVSARMGRALEAAGHAVGPGGLPAGLDPEASPTGEEYVQRVLDPAWRALGETLRTGVRVAGVGREGVLKHEEIGSEARARRPFRILLRGEGAEWLEWADLVFDCTGKFGNPNALGDGGIPAPGEELLQSRIARGIPRLEDWTGRTILLVGAGHSAQTAARELARLAEGQPAARSRRRGTRVLWALRREEPGWGAVPDDPLPLRRELTTAAAELAAGASPAVEALRGVVVDRLEEAGGLVRVHLGGNGVRERVEVDRILSLTGGVGDPSLYRQLQVHECYATCGPMKLAAALLGSNGTDCLEQETHGAETLTNPEPGFYILGDKSYGRNNTFLLRVGWGQVDEVFAGLAPAGERAR